MLQVLKQKYPHTNILFTMGKDGSRALTNNEDVKVEAMKVNAIDTTGAGDGFFTGVAVGLTYGKSLKESCEIGTRVASSVISNSESVCPRFEPAEFDLDPAALRCQQMSIFD